MILVGYEQDGSSSKASGGIRKSCVISMAHALAVELALLLRQRYGTQVNHDEIPIRLIKNVGVKLPMLHVVVEVPGHVESHTHKLAAEWLRGWLVALISDGEWGWARGKTQIVIRPVNDYVVSA